MQREMIFIGAAKCSPNALVGPRFKIASNLNFTSTAEVKVEESKTPGHVRKKVRLLFDLLPARTYRMFCVFKSYLVCIDVNGSSVRL